jgi:general stress protein YciG
MAGSTDNRGLGSPNMSEEEKRKIRSMGGRKSPAKFEAGSKRAREAGRRGGQQSGSSR